MAPTGLSAPPTSLRERLREVMEPHSGGPGSTRLSLVVDVVVVGLILGSSAMVVAGLLAPSLEPLFEPTEHAITVLFAVEYLLRWWSARDRWRYPFTGLALLDLLAIGPGLLAMGSDLLLLRAVRAIRLLRLARLLRILRYGPLIHRGLVLGRVWGASIALRYRLRALSLLFLGAVVALVAGANLLYLTEAALGDGSGPFASYWRSYWNVIIVLVSGIEDKEPVSLVGRVEMTVLLIVGLVIVGMLTAEIVAIIIRRAQRAGKMALKPPTGRFEGHVVILGSNRHIDRLLHHLATALRGRHHLLVVDPRADQLEVSDHRVYRRVFALPGEPRDPRVLEQADLDRAARVIVLAPPPEAAGGQADDRALMAMLAVLCRSRSTPVVVQLEDQASVRYTHGLPEVDFVLARGAAAPLLAQAVLNPGVTAVYERLLTFSPGNDDLFCVPVPPELVGQTFAAAQLAFLDSGSEPVTLVGVDRSGPGRPIADFRLGPEPNGDERPLSPSDRLLVLAPQQPRFAAASEDRWQHTWLARGKP